MPELAACLDPQVAGDLEAVIEFDLQADIKDAAKDVWHLLISNRSCQAVAGPHPNPTTAIQTSPQILVDIIMQRLEVRRAIADRRLTVSGDRTLLAKLGRLFPPPSR
jgi:putative sterol carrier protein